MMSSRLGWNAGLSPLCENMLTGRDKNGKKDLADMVNWALISNLEFSFACPQVENQRDVKSNSISFSIPKQHYTSFPNIVFDGATIRRGIYMSKPLDTSALAIVSCHRSNDRL